MQVIPATIFGFLTVKRNTEVCLVRLFIGRKPDVAVYPENLEIVNGIMRLEQIG